LNDRDHDTGETRGPVRECGRPGGNEKDAAVKIRERNKPIFNKRPKRKKSRKTLKKAGKATTTR